MVRITDQNGDPWFVAKDICDALGFRMASDATRLLDEDEKGTLNVRTPGGDQPMTIINESGLYSLILRSRKPEAKRFKKWVTGEALAITTQDNKCYFSPSHVCDALGISWAAQFVKIQADPVLSGSISIIEMEVKRSDTGGLTSRKVTAMPVEFLSGWLFTIKKVRPELQAKLNLYRAEGFRALDGWFRQGLRNDPVIAGSPKYAVPQTKVERGVTNFRASSYINTQNKQQPMYLMDRKGFTGGERTDREGHMYSDYS